MRELQPTRLLLDWYKENFRPLPWRESRDPYRIWISEIMLQQTTATAVIPYYERFLARFPNLTALAQAPLEAVIEKWAGLGYYSRARNLHKAAQILKAGFPKTVEELLEIPGLGPYTARAVGSFAFSLPVGVLDGNVIRFLSRFHGKSLEWWKPKGRNDLQSLSDQWVQTFDSHDVNQALIEIGATLCLPQNPKCLFCPMMRSCTAKNQDTISMLPLKKPKRQQEYWLWELSVPKKGTRFGLIKNETIPFLKGHYVWPGTAKRIKQKPKTFDFKHSVTHHNIYVRIKNQNALPKGAKWLTRSEIKKYAPTSMIEKVLDFSPRSQP